MLPERLNDKQWSRKCNTPREIDCRAFLIAASPHLVLQLHRLHDSELVTVGIILATMAALLIFRYDLAPRAAEECMATPYTGTPKQNMACLEDSSSRIFHNLYQIL